MTAQGVLILVPAPINTLSPEFSLPETTGNALLSANIIVAEHLKNARRLMKNLNPAVDFNQYQFFVINRKRGNEYEKEIINLLLSEKRVALLSDAGMPSIADPGASLVLKAHEHRIKVVPAVGPSSFFLALAGSGLNGQSFCFHGYLPHDTSAKRKKILQMEKAAVGFGQTQLFMETPYRNQSVIKTALETLHPNTLFCVAAGITNPDEFIETRTVKAWKGFNFKKLNKIPAVFLIGA